MSNCPKSEECEKRRLSHGSRLLPSVGGLWQNRPSYRHGKILEPLSFFPLFPLLFTYNTEKKGRKVECPIACGVRALDGTILYLVDERPVTNAKYDAYSRLPVSSDVGYSFYTIRLAWTPS